MNHHRDEPLVAVTGAANGIGLAIAQAFLEAQFRILAIDVDSGGLKKLQTTAPQQIDVLDVDVADFRLLRAAVENIAIDHLVCAAGRGSGATGFPFWNIDPSLWQPVLEVTLMGTVNAVHAFVPALLQGEPDRKSILMITSVAGQIGSQTDPPYSASKAAVINFAQVAARDLAAHGVRVNALSPGMVQTDLNRSVYESSKESSQMSYEEWGNDKVKRVAPLGRWQQPEEFGAMAVFLASEQARNITGQTINIDGGQVMHS